MDGLLDPRRALPRVMILDVSQLLNALILCALQDQPKGLLARSGLLDEVGGANVVPSLADAWRRARTLTAELTAS